MSISSALTADTLKSITDKIFSENSNKNDYALRSDVNVQGHFSNSYQARYFLELLQNSRDAIVAGNVKRGKVKSWIRDDVLYFANNGLAFSEEGVYSICYPAISTKESREFVGHKGVGFSAMLEITDTPEIITEVGTFYFSTQQAASLMGKEGQELPMFQFPMFSKSTITDLDPELSAQGFTVVFRFPLKPEFIGINGLDGSDDPTALDLIFLSAIKELDLPSGQITIDDNAPLIMVAEAEKEDRYFRSYKHSFTFDEELIETFKKNEKEQFKDSNEVVCEFLLPVDDDQNFIPDRLSKLHLYYGMDFNSGFKFAIHSLFSVSFDRKKLAKGLLNDAIFIRIAEFYCTEFVELIKRDFPKKELEILSYSRKPDHNVDVFYNQLKKRWAETDFIYHNDTEKYLKPGQVYLVNKEEYKVFRDGRLGDMALLLVDTETAVFLKEECGVSSLPDHFLKSHIDEKCSQFSNDPSFFQDLYNLVYSKKLYLRDKHILLSQNNILVSGNTSEVYMQRKNDFVVPAVLESEFSFIHDNLSFSWRKESKDLLGIREYNEPALITAAIRLLKKTNAEITSDQEKILAILSFLKQLKLSTDDCDQIYQACWLPVRDAQSDKKKWVQPIFSPVYMEGFQLEDLYGQIDVIDLSLLNQSDEDWSEFLYSIGIWNIPAAYIIEKNLNSENEEIEFDRILHMPKAIDERFSKLIIENWTIYERFVTSRFSLRMDVTGRHVNSKLLESSLYKTLLDSAWIRTKNGGQGAWHAPTEILGISPEENRKTASQVISTFIPVWEVDYHLYEKFITDFSIKHIGVFTRGNFESILSYISTRYADLDKIAEISNFEKFFNRILSFLYNFLNSRNYDADVISFKEQLFLSRGILSREYSWTKGADCLHIDDKNTLDRFAGTDILSGLASPYSFTKRDKNEWGKFANRIGRPLSKLIQGEISTSSTPFKLTSLVSPLDFVLAYVENDLPANFSDDIILEFKEMDVYAHNSLTVAYTVEGSHVLVQQDYYLTGTKDKILLHIDQKAMADKVLLSVALQGYFELFVNEDLKRLNIIFEYLLSAGQRKSKMAYAEAQELDSLRIDEIAAILKKDYYVSEKVSVERTVPQPIRTIRPEAKPKTTIVLEEISVIESYGESSLQDHLHYLNGHLDIPFTELEQSYAFISRPETKEFGTYPVLNQGMRPARIELGEKMKKEVGFMAEYYIYQRLQTGNQETLERIGIDLKQALSFKWYNVHRLEDFNLPDGSMGAGHDFYHEDLDIAIEVKGMVNHSAFITITGPEFDSMRALGERYFLIIVKHLIEGKLSSVIIQNPYAQFLAGQLKFLEAKTNAPR
ncbi:sacsin N-terminal ATP-binding-like domain-containing protein [Pedobacter sp. KACC 23697]|uniref:DUF3883 domain-containing protein n=1 Tax=Pedobacter sp. KACC 23697 TaxID=3149230 RepID=A0AAU7K175_9SPHI